MTDSSPAVRVDPLEPGDPPSLGEARLTGRLDVTDSGVVYAGVLLGDPVAVVLLTEGAETDSFGRARFEQSLQEVTAANPDAVLAFETDDEIAPWAVLPATTWQDGHSAARSLLAPVTLENFAPVGEVWGPGFRPHWFKRAGRGRWRVWPLPWPSVLSTAGRWTYLAAFGLILAIAAIALWIAVQVFQTQPPAPGPGPAPGPLPPQPSHSVPPSQTPTPTPNPTPTPTLTGSLPTVTTTPPVV